MTRAQQLIHGVIARFPSLGQFNREPFDYDDWKRLLECGISKGERHAVRFILDVWKGEPLHDFNLIDAIGSWDQAHQMALAEWCRNPVWP